MYAPATTEIYTDLHTLSLHDALPISHVVTVFGEIFKFPEMIRHAGFFRAATDRAHKLLSCSEHCGRSLASLGVNRKVDAVTFGIDLTRFRSEEHTSEIQSLMRISYAVFCLQKKK